MILSQLLDLLFRIGREQTIEACGLRYHDPQVSYLISSLGKGENIALRPCGGTGGRYRDTKPTDLLFRRGRTDINCLMV
jgi:hypothetical protein